jgi:hypothetical protein
MKNQNTKLAAFVAAGVMAAFAADQAEAGKHIGQNLSTPCDTFVANCQRLNPNPELCPFLLSFAKEHDGDWASAAALSTLPHPFRRPPRYGRCSL